MAFSKLDPRSEAERAREHRDSVAREHCDAIARDLIVAVLLASGIEPDDARAWRRLDRRRRDKLAAALAALSGAGFDRCHAAIIDHFGARADVQRGRRLRSFPM